MPQEQPFYSLDIVMVLGVLTSIWNEWKKKPLPPKKILSAGIVAIRQDFEVLLQECPNDLSSLLPDDCEQVDCLTSYVRDSASFLNYVIQQFT